MEGRRLVVFVFVVFLVGFDFHEGFKQPWRGFLERFEEADSGLSTLFFEGNN